MSEATGSSGGAAPSAPSSPAGVAPSSGNNVSAPAQSVDTAAGRRISDFETAMERKNERKNRDILESQRRSTQEQAPGLRDVRDKGVDGEEAYGLEAPVEIGEVEPKQPGDEGKALDEPGEPVDQPQRMQAQDKELLDATKQWLSGAGEMPEAFKNQVFEWADKTTGGLRRMTIPQMQEAALRQGDYSSKMNELRNFHQQVQWQGQAQNQFWQNIQKPQQLLEELEDRGYSQVFHQAAVEHSNRRMKMKQVAEAAGYALMQQYGYQSNHPDVVNAVRQTMAQQQQNYAIAIENRKLARHNQLLAQQNQQTQQRQQQQLRVQDLSKQLEPLIPTAFKVAGVRNQPANVDSLYRHLNAYLATIQGWDGNVRNKHLVEAAKMVREELDDMNHARRPKPAPAQSRALGPARQSGSGNAASAERPRGRPSEFEDRIMQR